MKKKLEKNYFTAQYWNHMKGNKILKNFRKYYEKCGGKDKSESARNTLNSIK